MIRLLEVLDGVRSHPFLKSRMVLKGGTALNLFVLDVPRLSVDIDLNYIGAADREAMLAERPQVEQALQAVFGRLGLQVRRVPGEHAGGKWRLSYTGVDGRPGTLEVDVNFLLRTPLWPPVMADSDASDRSASAAFPCWTSTSSWPANSPPSSGARRAETSSMCADCWRRLLRFGAPSPRVRGVRGYQPPGLAGSLPR